MRVWSVLRFLFENESRDLKVAINDCSKVCDFVRHFKTSKGFDIKRSSLKFGLRAYSESQRAGLCTEFFHKTQLFETIAKFNADGCTVFGHFRTTTSH